MRPHRFRSGLAGPLLAVLLALAWVPTRAQEVITFMPQWTPQTQFAGYYVALEKGFYAEEGIDVIIDHFSASSTESIVEKLVKRKVDIITNQLIPAMISRGNGVRLINVLQTSQVNGLMCAAHFPIESPASLNNVKIGRWKSGFAETCEVFCYRNNLEVQWIPYIQGINLYVSGAVDALLCYSYSEYLQLLLATGGIPQENVIRFRDYGLDFPEDGVYVTERFYYAHKDAVDKFVRASRRGWEYAREHREEALDICMNYIREFNVASSRILQKMMLDEVLSLQVNPETGKADYAPVSQTVFDALCSSLIVTGHLKGPIGYKEMIR